MSYFGLPLYPATPPNQQAVVSIVGNTTLGVGAATYDKQFLITGAGGYTISLPAIDGVNFPSRSFTIFNNSSSLCTINTNGSDTALLLGSSYSSISILPGERFLVQNMVTSWVVALESASRTTTAPQFDNTIRNASTAFVQKSLGSYSSVQIVSTTSTLGYNAIGGYFLFTASSAITITLPSSAGVASGSAITFTNGSNGGTVTIGAQGGDYLFLSGGGPMTLVLKPGDTGVITYQGSGYWTITGGAAMLPYSTMFGSSQSSNGYQKLPGGMILQWGVSSSSSGSVNTLFPLQFPNQCLQVVASISGGNAISTADFWITVGAVSAASFYVYTSHDGSTGSSNQFNWFAIGR